MRLGFCAVGSLLVVVSGCSMNRLAVPVRDAGVAIRGSVRGGQQPINGMRVYLLAANTTGYGNASVSLLTSGTAGSDSVGGYVLSGSDGSFSISGDYTCTTGTQVYLYGLGGNPGGGVNASAGLMAALGNCPAAGNFAGATPFIAMNEVSTVAAAYAMAGFATDATHVSSSGTALAQVGTKNAFANAANLETLSTGAALATTTAGNGTVPQAEINSLADVLAACLNTDGTVSGPTTPTPCYTLFMNALSGGTTGTQAGDTATAAINIAHHPIANVAGLYGLVSASAPFQPTLTAVPNDWTVAVIYTTVQLDSNGNGALQNSLAIDGQGNVWIANQHTTSLNLAASVSELSSNGTILSGAAGFTGGGIGGSSDDPGAIAIDPSGNVWVSNGYYNDGSLTPAFVGLGLTELSSSGTAISGAGGYTTGCGGQGLAIDGSGNVWTSAGKCDSSGNYLFAVPSPPPLVASYPNEASSISIDTSGNAWYSGTTKITTRSGTQPMRAACGRWATAGRCCSILRPYGAGYGIWRGLVHCERHCGGCVVSWRSVE